MRCVPPPSPGLQSRILLVKVLLLLLPLTAGNSLSVFIASIKMDTSHLQAGNELDSTFVSVSVFISFYVSTSSFRIVDSPWSWASIVHKFWLGPNVYTMSPTLLLLLFTFFFFFSLVLFFLLFLFFLFLPDRRNMQMKSPKHHALIIKPKNSNWRCRLCLELESESESPASWICLPQRRVPCDTKSNSIFSL